MRIISYSDNYSYFHLFLYNTVKYTVPRRKLKQQRSTIDNIKQNIIRKYIYIYLYIYINTQNVTLLRFREGMPY